MAEHRDSTNSPEDSTAADSFYDTWVVRWMHVHSTFRREKKWSDIGSPLYELLDQAWAKTTIYDMSKHLLHHPDDLVFGGLGLREVLGLQHLRDDGRLLLRVWTRCSAASGCPTPAHSSARYKAEPSYAGSPGS